MKKKALLLDMNGTFMFDEDRFGASEDFYREYSELGKTLAPSEVNRIIRAAYASLSLKYTDEKYRENFPSLEYTIREVANDSVAGLDIKRLVKTFASHELGYIPNEFAEVLHLLSKHFVLSAVIDIWAPEQAWLKEFKRAGVLDLFSSLSFSSMHGKVKPSSEPFKLVLNQIGVAKEDSLVIGDSIRRDLGGAVNAGIDCILVGGAEHPDAIASYSTLIELYEETVKKYV